jgi:hypothetical protein
MEAEILQQFVANIDDEERKCVTAEKAVEIATTLENLEANLKGSTCAQRRKKHGVGTHSPIGDRKRLQTRPKQHAKELRRSEQRSR